MSNRVVVWLGVALSLVFSISYAADVYAQSHSSNNFRFEESVLGTGGLIESSSTNFRVTESVGDGAAGDTSSTNFNLSAGSKTTDDPALAFQITNSNANFDVFSPATTASATSSFSVINYTSWGYVVQILGSPPSNQTHTLAAMATTAGPAVGTEQFGINLAANTSPSVGANPVQGIFGAGVAATNYSNANQYRYVSGETIASAPKSSGVTTYMISYIVNVTSLTPGGEYKSDQTLVCTGTY